ncbi:MAG: low specificity L-threonine aldolase, partial [Proteobacteria bacterium]
PSGTMAQLIALRIWCDRKKQPHFAMHATSHLALHEQNAYEHLHNLKALFLGDAKKCLTLRDFESAPVGFAEELSAALIELPQRELGGVLPTWPDLVAMSEYCRSRDVKFHLDGARLWETAPHYQRSYAEICSLFDSVYVSFYKGLGGITGAVLAGPTDFIAEAKIWQRRYGGNLYRLFPYVISAREALKLRLPKMNAYHEKAVEIALALSSIDGLNIEPSQPVTNMMHLTFAKPASEVETAFIQFAKENNVAGFFRLQPADDGVSCKAELNVGDATLDLPTANILQMFESVLKKS